MSDHWNDLADTLGTPSLTPPKRKPAKSKEPVVSAPVNPATQEGATNAANLPNTSGELTSSKDNLVSADPETPTQTAGNANPPAVESVTRTKKRSGWDSLSKLFGIGGTKSNDSTPKSSSKSSSKTSSQSNTATSSDFESEYADTPATHLTNEKSKSKNSGRGDEFDESISFDSNPSDEPDRGTDEKRPNPTSTTNEVDPDSLLSRKSAWSFEGDETNQQDSETSISPPTADSDIDDEKSRRSARRGKRGRDRKLPKMWEDNATPSNESADGGKLESSSQVSGIDRELSDDGEDLSFDGFGGKNNRRKKKSRGDDETLRDEDFGTDETSSQDEEGKRGRKKRGGRRGQRNNRSNAESNDQPEPNADHEDEFDPAERRGRRRRPRRAEALEIRDNQQSTSKSRDNEVDRFDDDGDELEPRRNKRSRQDRDRQRDDRNSIRRNERDESDLDDLDFDEEPRSRRRSNRDDDGDNDSERSSRRGNRGRRGRRGENRRDLDEDDNSPRAQRQRKRNAKIPTWLDAITPMIDSNIENHERQSSGSSKRRSPRGNNSKSR